jgi:hypothetical protein
VEAFVQALEDAQAAGGPVADIAAAMADGEAIKTSTVGWKVQKSGIEVYAVASKLLRKSNFNY